LRRKSLRARLAELEDGLTAGVYLLELTLPREERAEQVVGFLTAGLAAGVVSKRGCAVLLRRLARAGWRFEEEVDAAGVEGWMREVLSRIERGEEPVS